MLTGIQIQLWPLKHIVALEQDFLKDTDMEAYDMETDDTRYPKWVMESA